MFREEVFEGRKQNIGGRASIAIPISWRIITGFGVISFGLLMCFLAFTPFARSVSVHGALARSAGIAEITAQLPGIVSDVSVTEGQQVAKGAALATIATDRFGEGQLGVDAIASAAIADQATLLTAQASEHSSKLQLDASTAHERAAGIAQEIHLIEKQLAIQRGLIETAEIDLDRVKEIANNGFISGRDLRLREEALVSRQLTLSQLQQTLIARKLARAEALNEAKSIQAFARSEEARLGVILAGIKRDRAEVEGRQSYILRSPIPGRVTALIANVGRAIPTGDVLMAIEPQSSELIANLHVSTEAVGFIHEGQVVRLAVDAFPYQRFGHISGKIIDIASAPSASAEGHAKTYFIAKVGLTDSSVRAFGKKEALKPGMLVEGKVVIARQSFFEWLFEPLFAAKPI